MGARAKQTRVRRKKGASSSKISARKQHTYYPDSIPPGMTAEVFDVSRIDEDGLEVLDDDEVVADSSDEPSPSLRPPPSMRPPSMRPSSRAPHPPRPSVRPRPLAPDDLHLDTPLSYAGNPAPVLLPATPPAVAAAAPAVRGRTFGMMVAAAIVALVGGMALGRRDDARPAAAAAADAVPVAARAHDGVASDARFSEVRAHAAIDAAVVRARACRDANAPSGPISVRLTVAQTGQTVGVEVEKPFSGTPAGDCFGSALRDLRVPSFEGGTAMVERTVEIP